MVRFAGYTWRMSSLAYPLNIHIYPVPNVTGSSGGGVIGNRVVIEVTNSVKFEVTRLHGTLGNPIGRGCMVCRDPLTRSR